MGAWRIHLTDQTIRRLDILSGRPSLLAAWLSGGRAYFFDLSHGTRVGERTVDAPGLEDRSGDGWRGFLDGLTAPNGVPLPVVRLPSMTLYSTAEGRAHLIQQGMTALFLDVDGTEIRLHAEEDTVFVAVDADRGESRTAALDAHGRLLVYHRHLRVAAAAIGLHAADEWRPGIAVAQGGTIFATDGHTLVKVDAGGRVRKRLDLHYHAGMVACSPDGSHVATTDAEIGVIRVYDGADLQPTHQRFASDLFAEARRAQLMGGSPGASASISALALSNRGVLAFALSGALCVSSLARMGVLPRV